MFESRKRNRDSRAGFERELNLLAENLKNGKMIISIHMKKSAQELTKVRSAPNNRFDLNTVSEIVRTMAMSVNFKHDNIINSKLEKETEDE